MSFVLICRTSILVLSVFCFTLSGFAQSIGIGTTTPAASAQLDVSSTTKGVLVPRVTTAQMNAIASPANGLLVYNTTAASFAYRTATGWVFLTGNASAGAGWSTLGNAGTNAATNFIGTTDDMDLVFKRNNIRAGMVNAGSTNTSLGVQTLNQLTTGTGNSAFGWGSLQGTSTGGNNTAMGAQTLFYSTTGSNNTALGHSAMLLNQTGSDNIAIGISTLGHNNAGNNGIAIGNWALFQTNNTTTAFTNTNIAIGAWALAGSATTANNTGLANNVIGNLSMRNNASGSRNSTLGTEAMFNNTTGSGNIAIGFRTLYNNTDKSGLVAIGDSALHNNGLGATEIFHATKNTAVGNKALFANTTGEYNTANGADALVSNIEGDQNVAVGFGAGFNAKGNGNVFIGSEAGKGITGGNQNTAVGRNAGLTNNGSANTFLGYNAYGSEAGLSNATAIGAGARVACSNCMALGPEGENMVNVGIGTSNPYFKLDVRDDGTNGDSAFISVGQKNFSTYLMLFGGSQSTPDPYILFTGGRSLRFIADGGGGYNERLTIAPNGYIGINHTTPGFNLDVKGSARLSGGYIEMNPSQDNSLGNIGIGSSGYNNAKLRVSSNQAFGAYIDNTAPGALALYVLGNAAISGSLSKGSGSFKIDHPLDPENKYLYHSFVESPDMMNVYNGNITTNAKGEAVVEMPEWFEALNKDFRYQLTVMGQFAQAIVKDELKENAFSILTDKPNVKVSWQITGIRKDAFAEKNRIPVEQAKPASEVGTYLHPAAFGQPDTKAIGKNK